MSDLIVNDAIFESLEGAAWVLRLSVLGAGFDVCSTSITAVVGDVPVELVVHNPDGTGFSGVLATVPPNGAVLKVGWTPDTVADTAVTFHAGPNA